ncbi:anthrone oxygenase family protein [Amycolatopsis sp. H20-H5]|uniref:anthrone oxygenase family protein n=1 Tax=Amycolatopsis sp. H20-H5 TaxID=3046309 RepID=UPI002DBDC241|nr:anthrone oxygenase family protein [Amycolatopsis sp. H20-H5]MEC3976795.1 anthrone oxygenase family protein [Amycolatopsis sp. H20-H5]
MTEHTKEKTMFDVLAIVALVAATIAAGLIAGLFYAYACSVMPGLALADDRSFVVAMREINVAILNGWFALTFAGAPVLAVVAGLLHLRGSALPWIVTGFVCLVVMLVITMAVNVPLNNALEAGRDSADFAALRGRFESSWVRWNLVRALVCTLGFGSQGWALVVRGRA